jgi:hypothetical protein
MGEKNRTISKKKIGRRKEGRHKNRKKMERGLIRGKKVGT